MKLPTISIVIPTYNEEKNIKKCLDTILDQKYPKELIEIIIVDNGSVDGTINIVKKCMKRHKNIKLLFNDIIKDAEISKMIGLKSSSGDLFMYIDADIELVGKSFLIKLVEPHLENPSIVGAYPRFLPKPKDSAIGRYLRYHALELDPVLQFFCTEIDETVIEDGVKYKICEFNPPKIPPIGICLYKREVLLRTIGNMHKFMDVDVPIILSKAGYNKFAYVPSCGIYHINVKTLKDLIKKRIRNLNKVYLPNLEQREFKYFNLRNKNDILRMILWIIYANLFIPKLLKGIHMTIKHKDIACMYEPIVSIILTDVLIWFFLKSKEGRRIIRETIKNLFQG